MAISIDGMDDLLKRLDKLADVDKVNAIAMKAVTAAQPMNESAVRSAIASVEHGPYSTGSVSGSVSSTAAKVNAYGVFAVARPTGRDEKGVRNGLKAAMLQYGSPKFGKKRLEPRPWRQRAVAIAMNPCIKTMEDVLKAEMELES